MPLLSLLALSLLCWVSVSSAQPSPRPRAIWSGLILATNDPHPAQPPPRLRAISGKLRNVFGYNQLELVGEYGENMDETHERMLVPSKDFSLSVRTHNVPGERYPTRIVLFQNHRRIAEIGTRLKPDSPLFIRGPLYARGQLIIVVREVDPSEIPPARPAIVAAIPSPLIKGSPPREKLRLDAPAAGLYAPPLTPFITPGPVDRLGPLPDDRFGPLPGERGGEDSKLGRP